jgi:signal transduction histidine kinase
MKELELRNRIASDLHDEVGSSLSSIHVLSHMANQKKEGVSFSQTLEKINGNARDTMERMSDIVWAIHPENDSLEQLLVRMKEFAADILEPQDINYEFVITGDISRQRLNINQRRDLYLIFKEAVNNAAKYSNCKNVRIELKQENTKFHLTVIDDGRGFNQETISAGNGLRNMRQRAKQMDGELKIDTVETKGTTVSLVVKT